MIIRNQEIEPDIIAITEVKPKSSKYVVSASEFNMDGFNLFSNDLEDSVTRGRHYRSCTSRNKG